MSKSIKKDFWEKLTEDQQAKLLAGTVGAILFLVWIILLFSGAHIV